MADPWQDHVAWVATPAPAFHVSSTLQPASHHEQWQPQRQRIGPQPPPPRSLSPPSAALSLWLPPATTTSAPAPAVISRNYAEDTSDFRRLNSSQLKALAAAAAAENPGDSALELLRLRHRHERERERAPCGCLGFCRSPSLLCVAGADKHEDELDDEARVEAYLCACPDMSHSAQGAAVVSALCRASAGATGARDGRAALVTALVLIAALVGGLAAGAAVASTAVAYGQATARAATRDAYGSPAVWTSTLVAALGAAGVSLGRVLLGLSAAAAVLASALSGFPLPSASLFPSSLTSSGGDADQDDDDVAGAQQRQDRSGTYRGRGQSSETRRDAPTGWAAAALLFAASHLAGLAAAPAEADLGARTPPARVPYLWHGATVARCALSGVGWAACCVALARRVFAGESAARRGRAAAWRAALSARGLVFGAQQQQHLQSRRQPVQWA